MKKHGTKIALTFIVALIFSAKGQLALSNNLPQMPNELPSRLNKIEGTNRSAPRYTFSESKDELTGKFTRTLMIYFWVKAHDRGLLGTVVSCDILSFNYTREENGGEEFFVMFFMCTDKPLANLFLPKHEYIYRPEGRDTISINSTHSKVEMADQLGLFNETAGISSTLEQMVELLTSPLLRLRGNEGGSKDFRLDEADKGAILWFLTKAPEGREAISRVSSAKP